jgi:malate dehydrogenase (oxaloacetate-decarboxylating)(NADP+)
MTVLAAEEISRFGIAPKVALLSHSNFGAADTPTAVKMRKALEILANIAPGLEVDGEMHGTPPYPRRRATARFPIPG